MPNRLLHVAVPRGLADRAARTLDEAGLEYRRVDGEEATLLVGYGSGEGLETATQLLRKCGIAEKGFAAISSTEALLSEAAEGGEGEEEEEEESERVTREELVSDARVMASLSTTFLILTAVSSVIATAGLLADSTAVVIGSMVIAPLIGPAMASSVGTVTGDPELFSKGIFSEAVGLMTAVISSAVFAALIFSFVRVPPLDILAIGEISERTFPDILTIGVAVGAGIAGALSLTTGVSAALVGVMIAVALIPPAATAGIGLALGDVQVTFGSTVLLLVNVFSINIAGTVTFRYQGYSPAGFFERIRSKNVLLWRVGVMLSFLILLSTVLGLITYFSYEETLFERNVRDALTGPDATLQKMEGVELKSFSVTREQRLLGFRTEPVAVVVNVWVTEAPPPDLAQQVADDVETETGRNLRVVVETNTVQVVN